MIHDLKLTHKETIKAPVSAVWKALTDENMIREYFYGTNVESAWKKGSAITFTGEWEGEEYTDKGTILEIEPDKKLRFDFWSSVSGLEDKPENYAEITYSLKEEKEETVLTVTQQGFKDREAYDHSTEGWKEVLGNLKELLEK